MSKDQFVVYLSGPMSGLPEHNYPLFNETAEKIRALGFKVVNPAELDDESHVPGSWTQEAYYYRDIKEMLNAGCNVIAVLPGWEHSRGARLEVHIGNELGMAIVDANTLEQLKAKGPWLVK